MKKKVVINLINEDAPQAVIKKQKMLMYKSGTGHWTGIPKIYNKNIPKKDNPGNTFIVVTGTRKKDIFWFDTPLTSTEGELKYWPL
jgi:hypothetical protein